MLGHPDPMGPYVVGRLLVMRARSLARGDGDMLDLIRRAWDARIAALRLAEKGADTAYLNSLIDGSGDLLAEDTFARLEPMFEKYADDAEMKSLLERASTAYGDAALDEAARVLAGPEAEQAIKKAAAFLKNG